MSDDDVSRYFEIVPVPFVQAVGRVVTYWAWSEALLEIHLALVWRAP
jgi:hypothetical protein